jgi:hypothetical protein
MPMYSVFLGNEYMADRVIPNDAERNKHKFRQTSATGRREEPVRRRREPFVLKTVPLSDSERTKMMVSSLVRILEAEKWAKTV